MPEMTAEDIARFRATVQLRDRCARAAMERHERAGLTPSGQYARTTHDAIEELIRRAEHADQARRWAPIADDPTWVAQWLEAHGLTNPTPADVLRAVAHDHHSYSVAG